MSRKLEKEGEREGDSGTLGVWDDVESQAKVHLSVFKILKTVSLSIVYLIVVK